MRKEEILARVYGYRSFRPGQEELIDGVLAGRDVFGIMPTGGGKSICYQLPGLMLPGITLVISPLISLMRDQVMALKAAGVSAAYINSTLNGKQMQLVYRNLLAGMYKIVYVSPERLDYAGFSSIAEKLNISLIAVDEAHCISQWGQDFRPSYLRILNFIDGLSVRPVVGAYTATATEQVREDVCRILKLKDPVQVVTGFDRPNLFFQVRKPLMKDYELLKILSTRSKKSGIVYCATRKNVESVCDLLRVKGFAATRYHAGLDDEEKAKNQESFIHDQSTVMVATNAFGMGIDKSNVSFVIHYNMPKSIEAYYQEAGRAGRDGSDADCILLFSDKDVQTARFLIEHGSENEEMDPQQLQTVRRQDMERLRAITGYCKTKTCLRGFILSYFGQPHDKKCGSCGNCLSSFEKVDVTKQAQMVLSCVIRIEEKLGYAMGASTVVKVLEGSKSRKLLVLKLNELSTYGLLKSSGKGFARALTDYLLEEGYLHSDLEYQTLEITESAKDILYRGKAVQMLLPKEMLLPMEEKSVGSLEEDPELFELLRKKRAELAAKSGIPAYMVFTNASLTEMAKLKPKTVVQLRSVSGVGEQKAVRYGKAMLDTIASYVKDHSGAD